LKLYKDKFIEVSIILTTIFVGSLIVPINQAYAFSKLKNGFETITTNYLIPLSTAVAGSALILYVILSYFKPEAHLKNIGMIVALSIISAVGLEMITTLNQSFS
jgi:hypothetical protein